MLNVSDLCLLYKGSPDLSMLHAARLMNPSFSFSAIKQR